VPGRVEILGKHTDYAGGRSVLGALDRGIVMAATPRTDGRVSLTDVARGFHAEFALDPTLAPVSGRWATYPMTVARRMARNFDDARRGADLIFASDLPSAAGMSSSSALVVAVFLALAEVNHLADTAAWQHHLATPESLAGYLGCVENGQSFGPFEGDRGVGTFGGSEDHTAILCCRAGVLSQFAFCPVRPEGEVAWPPDMRLIIAVSGIRALKTGGARERYNRAALAAGQVLTRWNSMSGRNEPTLAAVARVPGAIEELRENLRAGSGPGLPSGHLLARFEQFLEESEVIIPAAMKALGRGDMSAFGELVDRSQAAAEWGLGNQVPETAGLTRSARDLGAVAASAFGAGFGGSVWAMVADSHAADFTRRWAARYRQDFPIASLRSEFIVTLPGPGARRLD
jgi:galactokinase